MTTARTKIATKSHKETQTEEIEKPEKYHSAIGRRKTAVALVRLYTKGQGIIVNGKNYADYFKNEILAKIAESSLKKMKSLERFKITVKVSGGGIKSQAEAIRHGTARVLVKFNADFRKRLKRAGFLTRDQRVKERKKYGLKKARKSPRWSKR